MYLLANSSERPRSRHASGVFLHAHHRGDLGVAQTSGGAEPDQDAISFGESPNRRKDGVKHRSERDDRLDVLVVAVISDPVDEVLTYPFAADPINGGVASDTEQPGSDQTRGRLGSFKRGECGSKRLGCAILCCWLVAELGETEAINRLSVIPVYRFKVDLHLSADPVRLPGASLQVAKLGDHRGLTFEVL